jgi:hypothetical protein
MGDVILLSMSVRILDILLFLILMVLGIAAYFKSKNKAVKYTIILFPIIMVLNFLVILTSLIFHLSPDMKLYLIMILIVSALCFSAAIIGSRWYAKNKDLVLMSLVIFFELYGISSLFIFAGDSFFSIDNRYLVTIATAIIFSLLAYLTGISAMIIALVRPKPIPSPGQLAAE